MIPFDLRKLSEGDLAQLVSERTLESPTLDFKRQLPSSVDKAKHDFLSDVCAFANADGGDLVYGIDDKDGTARELTPVKGEAADAAKRRLGQVIDAGMEPRVQGIQFHDVPAADGYILIVRVPRSFDGPHRYHFNGHTRFVMRNGTRTMELTYDQIRGAFDRTATLAERARRFREERVTAILSGGTWKPMAEGPICVVHFIPITSMAGRNIVDIQGLYHREFAEFRFDDWGGASRALNLDGLVVHPGADSKEGAVAYTQVFRTGAMEALRHGARMHEPEVKMIPSTVISVFFHDAIVKLLKAAQSFGIAGPAVIGIALLRTDGYEFGVGQRLVRWRSFASDRPHLVVPEAWLESIQDNTDVNDMVRSLLDVLWQGFGVERCIEYDDTGKWQPRP